MNGRLYDPVLGRMLSTDNFIHEDAGLNGFNRYAYAFNNPLKYTDPDGEIPALVAIGVGALVGVLSNGIQNEINDRPFFENAGSAALMGGISGAISCGIGAIAADNFFLQMMLHGISSGVMSEVSGGSFASGFFSGALSSGVASSLQGAGAVAQILGGGVSGGFGSVMGGGSFLDGVRQGIITSGLNHVMHAGLEGMMSAEQDPPGFDYDGDGSVSFFESALTLTEIAVIAIDIASIPSGESLAYSALLRMGGKKVLREGGESIVKFSKKRHERPFDDLPKDLKELQKMQKDINRASNGKPNKAQTAELEKIKSQEKLIGERNINKDNRKK